MIRKWERVQQPGKHTAARGLRADDVHNVQRAS